MFAGLTVYNSEGGQVETYLDFDSRLFMLTPIILPILFLLSAKESGFVSDNGRGGVTRLIVTIGLFACYIASFAMFFAFATPRCATESLNNQGWYVLPVSLVCHIYNLGFVKLLLSLLIVAQTGLIMFYLYNSFENKTRNRVAQRIGATFAASKATRTSSNSLVGGSGQGPRPGQTDKLSS